MTRIGHAALVAVTTAALAASSAMPSLARSCVRAGGQGSGFTSEFAKFMADAALKNSIAAYGGTARGNVSFRCKAEVIFTHCTARQRACK